MLENYFLMLIFIMFYYMLFSFLKNDNNLNFNYEKKLYYKFYFKYYCNFYFNHIYKN